jgi:hypothetical protein
VSYDLAVWEGDRPQDDERATEVFERLYTELVESHAYVAATPRIAGYVESLLARWPDEDDNSPWSDGPLVGNARGPLFYFGITYSVGPGLVQEAIDYADELAARHGLVCYDPQSRRLR